jgi:hypothetical protein
MKMVARFLAEKGTRLSVSSALLFRTGVERSND